MQPCSLATVRRFVYASPGLFGDKWFRFCSHLEALLPVRYRIIYMGKVHAFRWGGFKPQRRRHETFRSGICNWWWSLWAFQRHLSSLVYDALNNITLHSAPLPLSPPPLKFHWTINSDFTSVESFLLFIRKTFLKKNRKKFSGISRPEKMNA